MSKLLSYIASLSLFASCAATGIHSPTGEEPLRVTMQTSGGSASFEIVNAAHTDPVELYSSTRSRGSTTKIANDSILLDLIAYLGSHNYGEYERPGSAKQSGVALYSRVFEIESSAGISHWGTTKLSSQGERADMNNCFNYFFNDVFNQIEAYQVVDNRDGKFQFKEE